MGGGGVVEGNLFFNLNRETHDTAALNSWGRRVYLFSDDSNDNVGSSNGSSDESNQWGDDDDRSRAAAAAKPRLIPARMNSWRNNLVSRLQVQQMPQIYTNTDYCLVAVCTWILTTRSFQSLWVLSRLIHTATPTASAVTTEPVGTT
jgi:hypothetical protein